MKYFITFCFLTLFIIGITANVNANIHDEKNLSYKKGVNDAGVKKDRELDGKGGRTSGVSHKSGGGEHKSGGGKNKDGNKGGGKQSKPQDSNSGPSMTVTPSVNTHDAVGVVGDQIAAGGNRDIETPEEKLEETEQAEGKGGSKSGGGYKSGGGGHKNGGGNNKRGNKGGGKQAQSKDSNSGSSITGTPTVNRNDAVGAVGDLRTAAGNRDIETPEEKLEETEQTEGKGGSKSGGGHKSGGGGHKDGWGNNKRENKEGGKQAQSIDSKSGPSMKVTPTVNRNDAVDAIGDLRTAAGNLDIETPEEKLEETEQTEGKGGSKSGGGYKNGGGGHKDGWGNNKRGNKEGGKQAQSKDSNSGPSITETSTVNRNDAIDAVGTFRTAAGNLDVETPEEKLEETEQTEGKGGSKSGSGHKNGGGGHKDGWGNNKRGNKEGAKQAQSIDSKSGPSIRETPTVNRNDAVDAVGDLRTAAGNLDIETPEEKLEETEQTEGKGGSKSGGGYKNGGGGHKDGWGNNKRGNKEGGKQAQSKDSNSGPSIIETSTVNRNDAIDAVGTFRTAAGNLDVETPEEKLEETEQTEGKGGSKSGSGHKNGGGGHKDGWGNNKRGNKEGGKQAQSIDSKSGTSITETPTVNRNDAVGAIGDLRTAAGNLDIETPEEKLEETKETEGKGGSKSGSGHKNGGGGHKDGWGNNKRGNKEGGKQAQSKDSNSGPSLTETPTVNRNDAVDAVGDLRTAAGNLNIETEETEGKGGSKSGGGHKSGGGGHKDGWGNNKRANKEGGKQAQSIDSKSGPSMKVTPTVNRNDAIDAVGDLRTAAGNLNIETPEEKLEKTEETDGKGGSKSGGGHKSGGGGHNDGWGNNKRGNKEAGKQAQSKDSNSDPSMTETPSENWNDAVGAVGDLRAAGGNRDIETPEEKLEETKQAEGKGGSKSGGGHKSGGGGHKNGGGNNKRASKGGGKQAQSKDSNSGPSITETPTVNRNDAIDAVGDLRTAAGNLNIEIPEEKLEETEETEGKGGSKSGSGHKNGGGGHKDGWGNNKRGNKEGGKQAQSKDSNSGPSITETPTVNRNDAIDAVGDLRTAAGNLNIEIPEEKPEETEQTEGKGGSKSGGGHKSGGGGHKNGGGKNKRANKGGGKQAQSKDSNSGPSMTVTPTVNANDAVGAVGDLRAAGGNRNTKTSEHRWNA